MESYLNRSVIILVPKKPFYDWLNYYDPDNPIYDFEEHNSLLIHDNSTFEEARAFIKANYLMIFEDQLYGMYTDESMWPTNRSFAVFNDWFSWYFSSLVEDLVTDIPIRTEKI